MNNLPKVIEPVGFGWHQKSVRSEEHTSELQSLRRIPGNGARKELDDYKLVNPKRRVMM